MFTENEKALIEVLMRKYNKSSIEIVGKVDQESYNTIGNSDCELKYDLVDNKLTVERSKNV